MSTDIHPDLIISKRVHPNYELILYSPVDIDGLFLAINSNNDSYITLDLKMPVEGIHGLFERSEWSPFDTATDNIECMFCGDSEPTRGVWTVSQHEVEFISHEECVEQLKTDIDQFLDDSSVDIVSRL